MNTAIIVQYLVYSVCVNCFMILTLVTFYADKLWTNQKNFKTEYDYVIVGSGTAGSLIASRITRETNYSYIILEAGGHSNAIFDIPVFGPMLHGSLYDWQYKTTPQDGACLAMKDKRCRLPQGRIVGGSAKLNNMLHIRGNISHYVQWFHGKYSEAYVEKQFDFVEKEFISLDKLKYESELAEAMLAGAKDLGYDIDDVNKDFKKGFMKVTLSQKNGKRWSTSNNIELSDHLLSNVLVQNVIIDKDKMARGVSFLSGSNKHLVYARKAVIISAGTFNTPQILQLSGIGPTEVLKPLGITVIKDLPVGKNLQDHVTTGLDLITFENPLKVNPSNVMNPYSLIQYFFNGDGPLTSPGCEVVGFLSTKNDSTPDLQFMVLPVGISSDRGAYLRKAMGIEDAVWATYFEKTFNKHTASILPIILHPKSRGYVQINSEDVTEPPTINPKYFSHIDDLKVIVKGLKLAQEFVNTEAMKILGAEINPNKMRGCEHFQMYSDDYWECYVRHLTLTSYHPVGTCSMGSPTSKKSVVDNSFSVIGVKNLYVVDGSVLPTLPSGNINAAIALMASIFFDDNILNDKSHDTCHMRDAFLRYVRQTCERV